MEFALCVIALLLGIIAGISIARLIEPASAKWIPHSEGEGICSRYWHSCSVCNYEQDDECNALTLFCPNCGAKMDTLN